MKIVPFLDHAQDGIRVNAVAPGLTETPMTQMWKDNPEVWNEVVSNVPMGRAAKPEEIAEVVVFLSSDAASFCNGYIYVADGGQVAH
ncbi:SDR family NAD(P)-dependent oxidoreductase [Lysinibacillus xylanilyticus]|uniref:SDR family NAD(P)-dependent oxidoreductase n=1 Tax=Lysinibacillus xylanilyticus TaxID=582475 RepID=UPI0036DD0ADD